MKKKILFFGFVTICLMLFNTESYAWENVRDYSETINTDSEIIEKNIKFDKDALWGWYNLEHYILKIDPNGGHNFAYDKIQITQYCTMGEGSLPKESVNVVTNQYELTTGKETQAVLKKVLGVIRKGYRLKGWSFDNPASVTNPVLIDEVNDIITGVYNGVDWADKSEHTIYAIWEKVTDGSRDYTGILDANGNFIEPTTGTSGGTSNENTGSETGSDGDSDVTTYKIVYFLGNGTNHKDNPTESKLGETVTLKNPTLKGYKFSGWYINGEKVVSVKADTPMEITVTAKWSKVSKPSKKPTITSLKNSKKSQITVKFKNKASKKVDGYEIMYSTSKKFKKKNLKVVKKGTVGKNKSVSYSRKKFLSGKNFKKKTTYYVRIRTYNLDSCENKYYSGWSSTKKIKLVR